MAFRVVMIDDDPDSFNRVRSYLDPAKYELHYAADPFAGVKLTRELDPAIIILDIRMPGMDGFEVCKRIRDYDATRQVPIIVYSVVGDEDDTYIRSLNLGAHAVVGKGKLSRLSASLERFVAVEDIRLHTASFECAGHVMQIQGQAERVWVDGDEKLLRPKTRRLLALLTEKPSVLVSSTELIRMLYDGEECYNRGPGDVHRLVHDLRREIEPNPNDPIFIQNQPRRGYRLLGEGTKARESNS